MRRLLTLLLLCITIISFGQDSLSVKTDTSIVKNDSINPPVFNLEIVANGSSSTGNVNRTILSSYMKLKRVSDKSEYVFNPMYTYGTQDKSLVEDEINLLFSYELLKHKPTYIFGYGDMGRSFKRKMTYRQDVGIGLGKYLWKNDTNRVSITLGIVNQFTDFSDPNVGDLYVYRMSVRLKGKHMILKTHTLKYLIWFKPVIENHQYYILNGTISYDVPLTKRLKFNTSFIYEYDNLVTEDVKPEDTKILFGLKYKI